MRDGRFQMQAASEGNGDDFIVVRGKNGGKLADAFGIAALGEADENFPPDAKDIATLESTRERDVFERSKLGEHLSERRPLAAAGFRSQPQNHRQFIGNDGWGFGGHGVRGIWVGGREKKARLPTVLRI